MGKLGWLGLGGLYSRRRGLNVNRKPRSPLERDGAQASWRNRGGSATRERTWAEL